MPASQYRHDKFLYCKLQKNAVLTMLGWQDYEKHPAATIALPHYPAKGEAL